MIKLADSVLSSATSPERRLQAILAEVGGAVATRSPNRHGRAVVSVSAGTDVDAFLAKLNGRDDVAYAELDVVDSAAGR